ncbi:hypothetical protein D7B24_008704 [Verticillium nonalfalfae]|uniref:Cyclase n=1 Tax=Verticillium nonalfalfae TaxID=1051616 RepID=A0A3M9YK28_9PEZI|nr:uncharacterized protein D7B24_008704 [Verticillium nonalfalfae]RNJ60322.1 hypothetical protein D7B24_008704 [Verticillium nonalfalfae]
MTQTENTTARRPAFSELPLRKGDPSYSAWGYWGPDDQLGTLNLITPSVVKNAGLEIKEGLRFSLNWSLSEPKTPGFRRHEFAYEHSIVGPGNVLDDTLNFNTQKSTQWDGLRHFAYQKEGLFYNGITKDDMLQSQEGSLGIHNWHTKGGITTRGFLTDYWAYAEELGQRYDPSTPHAIKYDDIVACLEWQRGQSPSGLEPQPGDILIIRSGFTARYVNLSAEEEKNVGEAWPPASCGLQQDRRLLQWLWDSKFAGVGGDAPGWEAFPVAEEAGFMFHEVLISGWGCPIAELLYLEDLAAWCRENKRWTFFLSSCPLNVHGGVASPANMIALV